MDQNIRDYYLQTGTYTYAGPYGAYYKSLPDDVKELGRLVCGQVIHRVTLAEGNANVNADLRYGDMTRYPWHRMRCEDDVLLTAAAMTAELFRMDERGFMQERAVEHKIVVCCRYVAVLMTAILRAKGIPARCRAGFAPYFTQGISMDHWITQYWSAEEERWISIDADAFFDEETLGFDPYDIPYDRFDWAAEVWLGIRSGTKEGSRFLYADGLGTCSLKAAVRYLFYDFHALHNQELTFSFLPSFLRDKLEAMTEEYMREFDRLAEWLLRPEEHFDQLEYLWEHERKYRILDSPLVTND